MIRGVIVLLKSGLLVAQRGFEKSNILSPLMSAAISLSEEMGMGLLKAMDYGDYKLYILTSNSNPEVLIVIAADREDIASEIKARELVNKIDRVIPKEPFNLVTGTLQDTVLRIIDDFMKASPELPSFSELIDISKVIFSGFTTEIAIQSDKEIKEFIKLERDLELKNRFIPRRIDILDPDEALRACVKHFYNWDILDAYNIAYELRSIESYSDLASLLAIKLGLIILRMPPNFRSITKTDIEGLMNFEVRNVDNLIADLILREAQSILEGKIIEYRNFLNQNIEKLANIFKSADEKLKAIYSVLLFSVSRHVLKSPLGEELVSYYKEKSGILYEIINSALREIEIFEILYAPKTWLDIQKILSENRLHYIEIKDKYESLLSKPRFMRIGTSWKRELLEISIHALSVIRPYILASLAAAESYGLSIRDRQQILMDAYKLVIEDIYEVIRASPPLSIGTYFDFYQLVLHLLMYLGWVTNGDMKKSIWEKALKISKEAYSFFFKLYARERITRIDFISRVAPIAFIMSKASLRLKEIPKELFHLTRILASFETDEASEIDSQRESSRFATITNILMSLIAAARGMTLLSLKAKIISQTIDILRRLITWAIHKGELSREAIDNYIDAVYEVIEISNDKQRCRIILRDLIDYAQVLVRDPNENRFEAAIIYKRTGEVLARYYEKFGFDEEIVSFARNYLNTSLQIWRSENYKIIPQKIEQLLSKIPPIEKG